MKKIIGIIAVIVIVIVVLVLTQKNTPGDTIKIGVIAPLTGPGAVFGNSLVKGIELAMEDLGETKNKYEIVIEDDGTNPATAASAAQKLANVDRVKAVISATSGTGNAAAPILEKAGVAQICTACADKKVGMGKYSYTASVQVEDEAKVWIDEVQRRGAKTVGFMSQIHPGINAVADAIEAEAVKRNMPVVFKERYDGNNRDFKTIISKASQAKADVYYVQAFPPSMDIVGQELLQIGVKDVAGAAGSFTVAAKPEIFNGHWYTEAVSDPEFTQRFERTYPDIRFNIRTAPYGYDAFNILVQGFEKGGDIGTYLQNLDEFSGKVGRLYKTDGNYFRSMPGVWEIREGKPVLVSQ